MTTLPPEPRQTPAAGAAGFIEGTPEEVRPVAEGFGADAGRYDRARPAYPAELVDRVITEAPGRDVLDVGCGTGICSRLFQAAGCRVLGVEPDPRMAGLARQAGTEAEIARFEDWDPAGRAFDAVIAAQAWHWVDMTAGAARAAAALRPGGLLAVFWNAFDPPARLRARFGEVYRQALPGHPFAAMWDRPAIDSYRAGTAHAAAGMRAAGGFGEPHEWLFRWERPYTRDELLDLMPTTGGFTRMPEAAQAQILAGFAEAVDAAGGSFLMGFDTIAVAAARA